MAITAKQVNELRKITGAGMMDCKKALEEAGGDLDKAMDLLRQRGQKIAAKRADRETSEGKVYAYTTDDAKMGIAIALSCETEPVANTDEFKALGQLILDTAVAKKPATAEELAAVEVDGSTISEKIIELSGKIGEKIEISGYKVMESEQVISYVHGRTIVVLVGLANTGGTDASEAGKDVAMQIAAMNPIAVTPEEVSHEMVEHEKQIGLEKAKEEGKPEHILERIAEGFVKKFHQENTLVNQAFVKDNKMTVKQYLDSVQKGLTVKEFVRIAIGR